MTELETQMIIAAREGQAQGYHYLMNRYGRQGFPLAAPYSFIIPS